MLRTKQYLAAAFSELVIPTILAVASLGTAFLISWFGLSAGFALLGAVLSIVCVSWTFANYRTGFFLLIIYCHLLFLIGSLLPLPVPGGTIVEGIMLMTISAIIIRTNGASEPIKTETKNQLFRNPIAYVILISICYDFVQLANPNSSGLVYSFMGFRESGYMFFTYVIAYYFFESYKGVKQFVVLWLALSLLGALNGLRQEYVGLFDYEWEFLTSDPRRWELYYIWGHVRKWSYFSDPNAFGLCMAFAGIFCFIISLSKFSLTIRLLSFFSALTMLVALSYSGTRTAYAAIVLGIMFYFLMAINSPRMIVAGIVSVLIALGIYFGPFYGPTLTRIRSTFNTEDASMSFRDAKRHKLQEHILTHPFGSGLSNANAIAERLTVTADPDNGFLRTAIDKGIPGLLIQFSLYFVTMSIGIRNFFEARDVTLKAIYAAFLSGLFAMVIANFYQDVLNQKPLNVVIISVSVLMLRMETFSHRTTKCRD